MKFKIKLFNKGLLKNGEVITLSDKKYTICFSNIKTLRPIAYIAEDNIIVHKSEVKADTHRQILERFLRKQARSEIITLADNFCQQIDVKYSRIAIKDQKSRWGSCSSKKNLNFNWRLVLAPKEVIEYVVAHEVAHLKHMNHSKDFWNCVSDLDSNYQNALTWLKQNGMQLHMY